MNLLIKKFEELSVNELYEILWARSRVFIVEQQCAYNDIDGLDPESTHVFLQNDEGQVLACLRYFISHEDKTMVHLGRILTTERGKGYGGEILKEGVRSIRERTDAKRVYIEAQTYASGYYAREGFKVISEPFLEDDIPHVKMLLEL